MAGTFEGLSLPTYGAFDHYSEAQVKVWSVSDEGAFDVIYHSTTTDMLLHLELAASAIGTSYIDVEAKTGASATNLISVTGSKTPTYLLNIANSVGQEATTGFFEYNKKTVSAPATTIAIGIFKVIINTKAYYIPLYPDTAIA